MDPEQRQRIIGYFLEESQEYLEQLEPGVQDLASALADPERINELYRAAHSIKGGAAMLELHGIQKVSYRLESSLKYIKGHPSIQPNAEIEASLLQGVEGLKQLIQELRATSRLSEESSAVVWQTTEPVFDQLDQILAQRVEQAEANLAEPSAPLPASAASADPAADLPLAAAAEAELLDADIFGELAANRESADNLGDFSWEDMEDLADLSDLNSAIAAKSWSTEASGDGPEVFIEGLDELANLFEENPLDSDESWSQGSNSQRPLVSVSPAVAMGEEEDYRLEDLFDDELLGAPGDGDRPVDDSEGVAEGDWLGHAPTDRLFDLNDLSSEDWDEDGSAIAHDLGLDELGPDDLGLDNLGLDNLGLDELGSDGPGSDSLDSDSLGLGNLGLDGLDSDSLGLGDLGSDSLDSDSLGLGDLDSNSLDSNSLDSDGLDSDSLGLDGLNWDDPSLDVLDNSLDELGWDNEQDLSDEDSLGNANNLDTPSESELDAFDLDLFGPDGDGSQTSQELANRSISSEMDAFSTVSAEAALNALDLELGYAPATSTGELASEIAAQSATEDLTDLFDQADSALMLEANELSLDEHSLDEHSLDADLEQAELDALDDSLESIDFESIPQSTSEDALLSDFNLATGDPSFDDLDSLLDDIAVENSGNADFDDLDTLLGGMAPGESSATDSASEASSPATSDAEFADMEELLQQAQSIGGQTAAAGVSVANKGRTRTQRLIEQSMRVPVKTLDNLSNLVGEMVVTRNSLEGDQERLRQALEKLSGHTHQLSDVGQRLQDQYERSLLENALLNSRRKVTGASALASLGISSSNLPSNLGLSSETSDDLDDLELDRFSSFHTLSQDIIELIVRIKESTDDIDFLINESLDQVARNFRQTTTQLQEDVNKSRMIPFSQTSDRLPRAVRDIARKCGKEAILTVEGGETLIDKMLVEQLHDPLTHLINNAVTHGIETQDERILAGKAPTGNIRLQAFYQGNQTVISVSDDGAGINPALIKRKAIEKGLLRPEEAENLGISQLYDFLFHAGFSTRDSADAFAGRGVGMDVVRTRLQELRGTIIIDSEIGRGTTFTIRLPLTLSITKALHCISNRARIAFPFDGVEDMVDIARDDLVKNEEDQLCVEWREMKLPVRELSDLLRYNRSISRSSVYAGVTDEDMLPLVILRSAGEYLAIIVDRVEGELDIVIKQLEGPVPKPTGIAGATVLADGQVMPIADVLELIDLAKGRTRQGAHALWNANDQLEEPTETPATEPLVLIVDDSITVRELLSMSFAKAGYRVEQARDGQEAWEKLRSGLPCNLIFCDIEMPRMTGLELLERLQQDEYLKTLPMAMLTSRGAERHRMLAAKFGAKGYFTKPYLEESLLEAAGRLLKGEVLIHQPRPSDAKPD